VAFADETLDEWRREGPPTTEEKEEEGKKGRMYVLVRSPLAIWRSSIGHAITSY
jgi:hypothetical protein